MKLRSWTAGNVSCSYEGCARSSLISTTLPKHPNYKYLSDYDKKNTFDMEKHLRRRPALVKPDEPFDYYEISEADLQEDTAHE